MPLHQPNPRAFRISPIAIAFVIWGVAFIHASSFITIDDRRSYSLFDDAMISMRYAWNLSHGNGLVWNPGERVQGYTNLLMTLLMSASTLVFSKTLAVLSIQAFGIASMLGIAAVTMKVSGEVLPTDPDGGHPVSGSAAFLLGLGYYPLAYWSLMGMETGLLTLFLLAGILAALRYVATGDIRLLFACSVLLGLAFLTRNDSAVISALVLGYIFWAGPRGRRRGERARWLLPVLVYFLVVGGQPLFQYLYYGEFLPNTYTLKLTGLPFPNRIRGGLGFVTLFLQETWLAFAIAIAGMLARFRREKMLLLLIAFAALGYQVYIGGDPWNYWRMLAPVMPLVLILAMDGLFVIYRGAQKWSATRVSEPREWRLSGARAGDLIVGIAGLMVLLLLNWRFLPEMTFRVKPYQSVRNAENVNIAIALNELLSPDASVGVFWAGAIPYFTERRAVDFLGKSDRRIAGLPADVSGRTGWWGMNSVPGHNKYDLQYSIVQLAPTFVQGFAYGGEDLTEWGEQNYARIIHRGIPLFLLRVGHGSQWDRRPGYFLNAAPIE